MKRPAGQVAWTSVVNVVVSGLAGVTGLVVARYLGASDRGILAAAFAWFLLMLSLSDFGLQFGVTYFSAREPTHVRRVLRAGLVLFSLTGLLAMALLMMVLWFSHRQGSIYSAAVLPFAILAPVAMVGYLPVAILQGLSIARWNLARVSQPLFYIAGLAGLFVAGNLTLMSAISAYCASLVLMIVFTFALTVRPIQRAEKGHDDAPYSFHDSYMRDLASFGIRNFPSSIPSAIYPRLDVLVLAWFTTAASVGEYAVAATIAGLSSPVAAAFANLALPSIASIEATADVRHAREVANKAIVSAGRVSVAASVLLALIAPWASSMMLGPGYPSTGRIAVVICAAQPFLAVSGVMRSVLRGLNSPGRATGPEIVALLVFALALVVGVPALGVWGAAVATVLGAATGAAAYAVVLRRVWARRQASEGDERLPAAVEKAASRDETSS